jgi:cysteinyl-tRNA synthetase
MKLLGPSFDLHLGGEDLAFPHHEDEIAQSEGACAHPPGERFVKYWLHAAHLLVDGRKMSKSLGNFYTLRCLLEKGFNGREIRYLLLTAHYRETFNFTFEGLEGARAALGRIDECVAKLRETANSPQPNTPGEGTGLTTATKPSDNLVGRVPPRGDLPETAPSLVARFTEAMDDDLNVSAAWAVVFDWVRETNRQLAAGQLTPPQAAAALAAWHRLDTVFGLGARAAAEAPQEILDLLEQREKARKEKNFQLADAIRAEMKTKGWLIEDTPAGPKLKHV